MSDLCKCGHGEDMHHRWQDDPVNCYGLIGGHSDLVCGCRLFAPARQVSEREVSHEERMEGCSAYAESVLAARQVSVTDTIETVLGEHRIEWDQGTGYNGCSCSWRMEYPPVIASDDYEGHVAAEITAALGPATTDAALAEAWDEGYGIGTSDCSRYLGAVEANRYPRPTDTPNPFRAGLAHKEDD